MIDYENLGKLNEPFFEDYQARFNSFLKSGWYVLGKQVQEFESEFAAYCGSKYFVGLASGLDALQIALKIYRFEKGSEVLVPSNTYIATVLAIVNNGLVPVLVEPNLETYNIDPQKIEDCITSKTVAIMPVHLYGKCCDMGPILEIAKRRGLKVIEDAAQAHGAKTMNKKAGTFGEFGAFSFYPTKNLGALGDGGGLATDDEDLANAAKTLRNYGSKVKYYNEELGYNSRLDEIQAAFLRVKLKELDKINNHKRKLAKLYLDGLSESFVLPRVDDEFHDVYHILNIRHRKRDQLKEFFLTNEIKTEIHYPVAPNKQPAMKGIIQGNYPIAEEIHQTTLSLPISFCHNEAEILKVIEVANSF